MNKLFIFLLSFVFIFVFTSCKEENSSTANLNSSTPSVMQSETSHSDNSTASSENSYSPITSSNTDSSSNNDISSSAESSSQENESTHTHSFSNATCTTPKTCSCGLTEGNPIGHSWNNATCQLPKTCSVCKITEGGIIDHIIESGLCKFCNQPIIVSPQNLDITKTYIHISKVDNFEFEGCMYSDLLKLDTIEFSGFLNIEEKGIYSFNKYEYSVLNKKITYNGKEYYYAGFGGVGTDIIYDITKNEIIIRDGSFPNEYAILNLLSDGSIKVISKTNNFGGDWQIEIGWIYTPTDETNF